MELPDDERWIPGYEGRYSVTRCGQVFSYLRGKVLKRSSVVRGVRSYPAVVVALTRQGGRTTTTLARAVLMAWGGPPPGPGFHADHIDHDSTNNHIDNLQWLSHAENQRRKNRPARGERSGTSKLTWDQVDEIRRRAENGESATRISADMPVEETSIRMVIRGDTWDPRYRGERGLSSVFEERRNRYLAARERRARQLMAEESACVPSTARVPSPTDNPRPEAKVSKTKKVGPEVYLTVRQVAEKLQLSEKTIRRLISKGNLPGKQIGRAYRVPKSELDAFLAE